MSIADELQQLIADLDVERRVTEAASDLERAAAMLAQRVGTLAAERRDDVDGWLARAGQVIDDGTDGRYADSVARLREQLIAGLDRLAEHREPPAAGDDQP